MSLASVIGALRVNLSLDTAEFNKGVKNANDISYNLKKNLQSLIPGIGAVGGAFVALGAHAVKSATEIQRFAQISNAGFEEFQKFAAGAKTVGIENEKLADILKDVNDRVGDYFATGAGPMADFFENIAPKVGLTADAFRDLSGPQALQLYVSSLEKAGLNQQDFTFYLEAMASDTTALIPLLKNGGAEMTRLGDAAKTAGAILGADTGESLLRTKRAMSELNTNVTGLSNILVGEAAPAIERISGALSTLAENDTVRAVVGGIAANFDQLAAFAGAAAVVMGGRFLKSLVMVNGSALTLTRTLGFLSTLRLGSILGGVAALAGGPLIAAAAAAALIGAEMLIWRSNTNDASSAMEAHERIVGNVRAKYAEMTGDVKDWSKLVAQTTEIQAQQSLNGLLETQRRVRAEMMNDLGMSLFKSGDLPPEAADMLSGLRTQFIDGALTIDQLKASLVSLAETGSEAATSAVGAALTQLDAMRPAQQAILEARALLTLTNDSATEAERSAAAATLNLAGTAQQTAAAATESVAAMTTVASSAANAAAEQLLSMQQKNELARIELEFGSESLFLASERSRIDAENEIRAIEALNISRDQKDALIEQVNEARNLATQMSVADAVSRGLAASIDGVGASINNAVMNAISLGGALANAASSFGGAVSALGSLRSAVANVTTAGADLMSGKASIAGVVGGAISKLTAVIPQETKDAIEARARENEAADESLRIQRQQNELARIENSTEKSGLAVAEKRNAFEYENEQLRIAGLNISDDRRKALEAEAAAARDLADQAAKISNAPRSAPKASGGGGGGAARKAVGGGGGGRAGRAAAPKISDEQREAERLAESQKSALERLSEEHARYQRTLGMSAQQEKIFNAVKQTGAAGDAEKVENVRRLIVETDRLRDQQEEMRAVSGELETGFRDVFESALKGADEAADAVGRLLDRLADMVLDGAFNMLWNGTGTGGFGGVGGGVAGIVGSLFGAIGQNANGTPNWAGGLTWVGERGPELVNLSRGSTVMSNPASRRLVEGSGGGNTQVTISLASGLVADIVGKANDNAVRIVKSGLNTYDNKQASQTASRIRSDPRAKG